MNHPSTFFRSIASMLVGILLWPSVSVRAEKLPSPQDGTVEVTVTAAGEFSSKYSNTSEALADLDDTATRLKVSGPMNGPDMTALVSLTGSKITELDLSAVQLIGEGQYSYSTYSDKFNMEADVIGRYMFFERRSLTSVVLPTSVKRIDDEAFYSCSALATVTCESQVLTRIGKEAFAYCKLTSLDFSSSVLKVIADEAFESNAFTELVIPASVDSIGAGAFQNQYYTLTSATLPAGLKVIPENMFCDCRYLETVVMPTALKGIGGGAFKKTYLKCDIVLPEGLEYIGPEAFQSISPKDCSVVIPSTVDSIGDYAFNSYKGQLSFAPNSRLRVLGKWAFSGLTLTEADLPNLQTMGESAFYSCTELTRAVVSDAMTELPKQAFASCSKLLEFQLPQKLERIGESALAGCSKLPSVSLPATVQTIGRSAFRNCRLITSIVVPEGVTELSESVFGGCTSLVELSLPTTLTTIGSGAFESCQSLTSLAIPAKVETIGSSAFYYCENLTDITLPENLAELPSQLFRECSSLKHVTLPAGASIANATGLFSNCSQLESVTLPTTAETIPASFFSNCRSLQSVDLPAGLKTIKSYAFEWCESLTAIDLPEGVTTIEKNAFNYCKALTSLQLPSTLTTIGNDCFSYCSSLAEEIVIPASVTSIGTYVFYHCDQLPSIVFPEGFTSIPNGICSACKALSSVTLPSTVTTIGAQAFNECNSLTTIDLPQTITTMGSNAFSYSALTDIAIPSGLTFLNDCFQHCDGLVTVRVPEGVTEMDGAFNSCSNLKVLYLPSTLTKIKYAFVNYCNALNEVHLKSRNCTFQGYTYSNIGQSTATLFIPRGTLDFYTDESNKLSQGWKEIVEEDYTFTALTDKEWQVLRLLPQQTRGDEWKQPWTLGNSPEETEIPEGVNTRDGHIVSIALPKNNLKGTLPHEVFELPYLESLDLSYNNLSGQLANIINKVETRQSTLTYLDLSNNQLTGNAYDICQKLPSLTTLNLSVNHLRDAYPALPAIITKLNIGGQDLTGVVTGLTYNQLYDMKGYPGQEEMPSILFYQHSDQQENCGYADYMNLDLTYPVQKPAWAIRFISRPTGSSYAGTAIAQSYNMGNTGWYRQPSGQTIYAWGNSNAADSKYSFLPLTFDFEPGDVDFNLEIDLGDMQKTLNFAVDSISYGRSTPFNFTAANLIADEVVNVQDVVASINLLLDQDIIPNLSSRRFTPPAVGAGPVPARDASQRHNPHDTTFATLFVDHGQLILESQVHVGALELVLSDTNPQWSPVLNGFSHKSRGQHTIFYSLLGEELPADETILAQTTGVIVDAVIVDRQGQRIPLAISDWPLAISQQPTANSQEPTANGQCYDLQGRRVSTMQSGVYVKNGKKVLVK